MSYVGAVTTPATAAANAPATALNPVPATTPTAPAATVNLGMKRLRSDNVSYAAAVATAPAAGTCPTADLLGG